MVVFWFSVDLRSLVDQNRQNFIPPTSRMTNYVVLKFGTLSNPSVSTCIASVLLGYVHSSVLL